MKLSGVIFLVVLLTLVLISSQARNLQASLQPQINSRTGLIFETKATGEGPRRGGCWKCWQEYVHRRL
ncbi:hypothetical protein HanXRQr2_Chr11g0468181 [Helianthus annuus]|uniref:Uncharacterized protein n=1 Tax=Helianthus annuus TaxID=4232 RepID=A0A9K3HKM3_HELAN|nr:hypothetical protein HanXRQr2_Chr11g0468181 [Helianthus annuus]